MNSEQQVDRLVREFAGFLNDSWTRVARLAKGVQTGSYLQDWCQGNWEALVEGALEPPGTIFLEVYGEGADCNERSSRVYLPAQVATHAVYCIARSDGDKVDDLINNQTIDLGPEGLPVEELASRAGTWYAKEPPFDCVLLYDHGEERLVPLDAVRFVLGPATRG